jgi:transglutaminase-like putative cysteine protease
MRFNITSEIAYAVSGPSTLILNVHALRNGAQMILAESFSIEPKVKCEEFVLDQGQNRFVRIVTGSARELKINYTATVETQVRLLPANKLSPATMGTMDRNVIPYIYPSRYCQSDKLGRLAYSKFGNIKHPYRQVCAIRDWIHENIQYLSGSTNWQTSAHDTVVERAGVCRDFAHLGIALCRALNLPARYFTGYAHQLKPQDFHACFEAHIGGAWLIFDATKLAPLNGLVRIATGRDAADAAVATIFGPTRSTTVKVSCEPADKGFVPLTTAQKAKYAVSLDAA